MEFTIMVGGEAGQGVATVGQILSKAFVRGGYHVFGDQDYESRIRGGHNFFRTRVSDRPVYGIVEKLNLIIALNEETIKLHVRELAAGQPSGVIYDSEKIKDLPETGAALGLPLVAIAKKEAGSETMANTVAMGSAFGLIDFDFPVLEKLIHEQFHSSGEKAQKNVKAARAGYDFARANFQGKMDLKVPARGDLKKMFIDANQSIAMGALAAGCKFMSGYPMTPSTPIMQFLADKADEYGLAVFQAEDEIAAMNLVIGASFAGVRAMTATSGGGFSLMVEGLGLAGMTETPVVIVEGQRPGPATGLPTRTCQGDLEFVLHAAQGEFPHIILAVTSIEDGFWATVKAFNLAERYQTPVIILNDHYLATSYTAVDRFDLSKVTVDRGVMAGKEEIRDGYKRHLLTPSGISPRAYPGIDRAVVVTAGDEHTEIGHITEDASITNSMATKRLRKLEEARKDMFPPLTYGREDADTVLVGWGSSYGPMREVIDHINGNGARARLICLRDIYPFPRDSFKAIFGSPREAFIIEQNATGQMAHLVRAETGIHLEKRILKYDGRPINADYIMNALEKEAKLWTSSSKTM